MGLAVGVVFAALIFAAVIGSIVLFVVALVDMVRRPEWQWKVAGQEKVLWIVLVCVVNFLGIVALIYWFNIRPQLVAVERAGPPPWVGAYPGGWPPPPPPPGAGWLPPASAPPPAPGWYPDPYRQQPFRYWDGFRWTEQTHTGTQ
jgi:Protein of unknown function (DUF2510)